MTTHKEEIGKQESQMTNYPDFEEIKDLPFEEPGELPTDLQRLMDAIKEIQKDTLEKDELVLNRLSYIADHLAIVSDRVERCFSNQVLNVSPAIGRIEAKVDAMENRLLPPGCLYIPKPEITPAGQTANVCIADAFHVADTHTEIKSFAEKEYSDNTAPKEEKPWNPALSTN